MKVQPISNRKSDATTEFMLREGIPITLRNWSELNYWRKVKLSELDAEAIAEIPKFLLPKKYRCDVPKKKAKVIQLTSRYAQVGTSSQSRMAIASGSIEFDRRYDTAQTTSPSSSAILYTASLHADTKHSRPHRWVGSRYTV